LRVLEGVLPVRPGGPQRGLHPFGKSKISFYFNGGGGSGGSGPVTGIQLSRGGLRLKGGASMGGERAGRWI